MNATETTTVTTAIETHPGVTFEAVQYVDPFPGRKGDEIVRITCDDCYGTGVYQAPSGLVIQNPYAPNTNFKGHFYCMGKGFLERKVSSVRASERRRTKNINEARKLAAIYEAEAPARALAETARHQAELDEAHAEAQAEQDRRDALVTGFVGEMGDRLKNLEGTITTAITFEVPGFNYGTVVKALVVVTLANGKQIKTVGTGDSLYGWERGDKVLVTGTVKDHGNYCGQDQTILTRAKIVKGE